MGNKDEKSINWKQIIITALITAILSLAVGYFLVVVQNKEPKLTYEVIENTNFDGNKTASLIYSVIIRNEGKIYIENIQGLVEIDRGMILDNIIVISKTMKSNVSNNQKSIEFSIPYFNPGEQFKISLVASDEQIPPKVSVDIRGSGIVGILKKEDLLFSDNTTSAFVVNTISFLVVIILITTYKNLTKPKK
jgi:hypothetical protein